MDVHHPEEKLVHKLKEEYGFHDLDVEDCMSDHQRSKVDEYKNYLFIILHVPFYDKRRQRVTNEEIDIFIKNDIIITMHKQMAVYCT